MIRGIDHVVIAVRDLEGASEHYRQLGFTVTPGGEHTGGVTHNALIPFADGSYLELIAFREPDREQDHKWWAKLANGEGTVDYALLSDGLAAEAARLRDAGIDVAGPVDGGRQRPDGQRIAWRSLTQSAGEVPLPFVIEDVTDRHLRVPAGAAATHPLGVAGVAGLVILVPNLERATTAYEALLGAAAQPSASTIEGAAKAVRIPCGAAWIELVEPEANADALQRHIRRRAAAPYETILAGTGSAAADLAMSTAHGARVRIEPAAEYPR